MNNNINHPKVNIVYGDIYTRDSLDKECLYNEGPQGTDAIVAFNKVVRLSNELARAFQKRENRIAVEDEGIMTINDAHRHMLKQAWRGMNEYPDITWLYFITHASFLLDDLVGAKKYATIYLSSKVRRDRKHIKMIQLSARKQLHEKELFEQDFSKALKKETVG